MAIRFIVDSGSDILPEEAKALGITVIPLLVCINGKEYADAVTLTHQEFYKQLENCKTLPTTSQAAPRLFTLAFRETIAAGDTPIAITISDGFSGTYRGAVSAAEEFDGKAYVVDSASVSVGVRLLVLRGLELAKQGLDAASIVAKLNEEKKQIRVIAILDTLEYLKKGGRISTATALAGSLLGIKPVVGVVNGKVEMFGKARGSKNANNLLRTMITSGNGVDFSRPYGVAYSGLSDELLRRYIEDSADLWQTHTRDLPVHTVGCVIGTHLGPGLVAVSFYEKN